MPVACLPRVRVNVLVQRCTCGSACSPGCEMPASCFPDTAQDPGPTTGQHEPAVACWPLPWAALARVAHTWVGCLASAVWTQLS
jgi:hypothetical protein